MNPNSIFGTLALGLAFLGVLIGRDLGSAPRPASPPSATAANGGNVMTCGSWGGGPAVLDDWGRMGSKDMRGNPGQPGTQGLNGGMWGLLGSLGMLGSDPPDTAPIAVADAQQRLTAFAASCGPDIHVAAVTPFANDLYAQLTDGTGTRLGEVLIDRYTGLVTPESGPNLLWNTRWGLAAGTSAAPRYDAATARRLAGNFLAAYLPGATVQDAASLSGYATFTYGRHQTVEGLLSVNAMTGVIWVHTWLGPALTEQP